MTPIRPYDPANVARVVEHARSGLSRAEIASALGASLYDFDAWERQHPAFAQALKDADTEALSWWDAQPRLAAAQDKSFRFNGWAKAKAERFGRSPNHSSQSAGPAKAPDVETVFEIPDNGRWRRRKGGGPAAAQPGPPAAGTAEEVP